MPPYTPECSKLMYVDKRISNQKTNALNYTFDVCIQEVAFCQLKIPWLPILYIAIQQNKYSCFEEIEF